MTASQTPPASALPVQQEGLSTSAAPAEVRSNATDNDVLSRWMGTAFSPDRLAQNLMLYDGIVTEIMRLRELDLTELHPAVIFDPLRSLAAGTRGGTDD